MKTKNKNLISLEDLINEEFGAIGTSSRDAFEDGYKDFKIGVMIQQARKEKGLTQEQLAEKIGTSKGNISKIENNAKDVRFSTIKKIIEVGLGGHLDLSIKF